jgi:hypothetical protein
MTRTLMHRHHSRFVIFLIFLTLLSACGTPAPATEVAQSAPSTTSTVLRPTATSTPTARSATTTPRRPTATPRPRPTEPTLTPTIPAPAYVPAGWTYHDLTDFAGFTFAVPASWYVKYLDAAGVAAMNEVAPPVYSTEPSEYEKLAAEGTKLIACECFGTYDENGNARLTIAIAPLPYPISLDEAVTNLVERIEQHSLVSGPANHERISHPAAPAEAIQYRMGSDESQLTFTQYVMLHEEQIVLVSIQAPVARAEQDTPIYYQIIQTLRFTTAHS